MSANMVVVGRGFDCCMWQLVSMEAVSCDGDAVMVAQCRSATHATFATPFVAVTLRQFHKLAACCDAEPSTFQQVHVLGVDTQNDLTAQRTSKKYGAASIHVLTLHISCSAIVAYSCRIRA